MSRPDLPARMPRRDKRSRWLWSVAVAAVIGCGLLSFAFAERPALRERRAMDSLSAHDWERMQYQQVALPRTNDYAATSSLLQGALLLEQHDFVSALRCFRHAEADERLRPLAWVLAGEALYAQNRFREAEANMKYALELDPDLVEAHRWLAIAYYDVGLIDGALKHLERVAELKPDDPRPHRIMAVIHMDHDSYALAVEDFEESLRRDPRPIDRQDVLLELAQAQLTLKRYEDAKNTLAQCEVTGEVRGTQADLYYSMADGKRAAEAARAALALEANQRSAVTVLASLALEDRRYDDAVKLLTARLEEAPGDHDLRYRLVMALRAAGRGDDAEDELAKVEQLREIRERFDSLVAQAAAEPYNADVRYEVGVLADRLSMPEIALAWFKAAVTLNSKHRLARHELRKRSPKTLNAAETLRGDSK